MNVARYRRYHAEQKHALYALVDPISPPPKPVLAGLWWRRRVLPPGPMGLLRRPFIAIAGLPRHTGIKALKVTEERVPAVPRNWALQRGRVVSAYRGTPPPIRGESRSGKPCVQMEG